MIAEAGNKSVETQYNEKRCIVCKDLEALTNQIPPEFLTGVAKERGVSDAELETVMMALDGNSTAAIATILGISNIAVRKRLGEVYRKFSIYGRGPGKLAELRHQLFYQYQAQETEAPAPTKTKGKAKAEPAATSSKKAEPAPAAAEPSTEVVSTGNRRPDWGESPDVSQFYGRTEELKILEELIIDESSRLVTLLGMTGIGKTVLSVQIAKQLESEFEFVVWRSLSASPKLEDLLGNLLQTLSTQKKPDIPEDLSGRILRLLDFLKKNRCLIILDDIDTLLKGDELAGNYRPGFENYRDFIKRIAETNHQSCFVLVTTEEPAEIALLHGEKVQTLQPMDSHEIAREIFADKGVPPTDKEWLELVKRYGDNLLAYKIVATTIKEFFNGNTATFLKATELFIEDTLTHLLEQHFGRLSPSEEEILYWLAIAKAPVTLSRLREDMLLPVSLSDMLKNLDSLDRRALIEKQETASDIFFTLQPLMMKFVSTKLVENACEEIKQLVKTQKLSSLRILIQHNLGAAATSGKKGKAAAAQKPQMVQQIKNQLQFFVMRSGGYDELITQLEAIAAKLEDKTQLDVGYASANLRNLLALMAG
ncbi:NB-ARC domain-containing protein [Laspinema sp. A4]|uniref:NB-ARC domain-containing protein n=1 Tax=Laspinema sp. D2d TaxID=2953686 RepID=UPI0021BACB43|nr:NB-ARC domain-containing protein [Laspinema sp. D2d]MCT7982300.1 NB-ARC domain-containing protein [Laspinema sp. D2d]